MNNNYKNTIFSLENKVALVVGGLGQIGFNSVKILLEAGAIVEVIDVVDETESSIARILKENMT